MAKQTTTKKAATKKIAAKKTAPVPAPVQTAKKTPAPTPVATKAPAAKKAAVKKSAPAAVTATPVTTIIAKCDAGFGNSIFIRGGNAGLSWDDGIILENKSADEWVWTSNSITSPLEFKLLLNDVIWSTGENAIVSPGETIILEPVF